MDAQERRARLARRHHLAPADRAPSPVEVARSLVALHSTDPASVYLASMARTVAGDTASVDRALYDERALVRMLGMRRTVFVVPVEVAPVVHAACTRAIARRERRKLVQLLEETGIAAPSQGARWLARVEEETLAVLAERGEAVGQELSAAVPGLREQISFGDETKKWAGVTAVTSRVLFLLAADGRIVRGRPRGSWTSSQYRWALGSQWSAPAPAPVEPPPDMARVELARRWLAAFGPATPADLKWWTGWTMGETKAALAHLETVAVDLDGQGGLVLADDAVPTAAPPQPWATLLPALDPTVMGWAERGWFLGDAAWRPALFDRSGNAGPTTWWDGQVVGAWAQRRHGEIVVRLLRDIGAEGTVAVSAAAERLRLSIGDVRITPRFRTPLERELTA
jgi:hypothetical protein